MRVVELLSSYEMRVAGEGPAAIVAELWHVQRTRAGGSVKTPIGHLAAAPRPAEAEAAAHWQAVLLLRSDDVAAGLIASELPEAAADWLLGDSSATQPLLLQVYRGRNTAFVQRGELWDDSPR